MATPLFLIAGIPASGKTHFAMWLESEKGFTYLDVDKDSGMHSAGLQQEWAICLNNKDASRFGDALRQQPLPVILEWGFPTYHLSTVEALKREGFSIWWFKANHVRAKKAFIQRATVPVPCFERQMQGIAQDWKKIEAVFAPNIITTLDAQGNRLSVREIFRKITERAG